MKLLLILIFPDFIGISAFGLKILPLKRSRLPSPLVYYTKAVLNAKEIIASGILERYLAGLSTVEETALVEFYKASYPEIEQRIEEIQDQLEQLARQHAKEPNSEIKKRIMSRIDKLENEEE